jgi:hypothetical protein
MQKSSSTAEKSNLLLDPSVLQKVFSYVGLGHHLYVTPVSKWWKAMYSTLEKQQLTAYDEDKNRKIFIIAVPQMTFYSSVFTSPSRVQLAIECGLDWPSPKLQRAAGKHADVATLTAAAQMGVQYGRFTAVAMATAGRCNKLAEVQFLYRQGCLWASELLDEGARSGQFDLVRWCCEHGCRWHDAARAPCYAAESGNVELMAWVLQLADSQLSVDVMCTAAEHGHTNMCQSLRAQRCPWSETVTRLSAAGGFTELLRWLMNNGCPWDAYELCRAAAIGGSIDVLTYLQQQGLLMTDMLTDMLDCAAHNNNMAAAKWISEQGAKLPARVMYGQWASEMLDSDETDSLTAPTN